MDQHTTQSASTATPPVARVVVPVPLDEPLTYLIPGEMQELVQPGVQVVVPLGKRFTAGIVWQIDSLASPEPAGLKAIVDVVSPRPFLPPDLMKLLQWISDYYICHLGEALRLINLNQNLKKSALLLRRMAEPVPEKMRLPQWWQEIPTEEWIALTRLERKVGQSLPLHQLQRLVQKGVLALQRTPPRKKSVFRKKICFALAPMEAWPEELQQAYRTPGYGRLGREVKLIHWLERQEQATREELLQAGFSSYLLRKLLRLGVLLQQEESIHRPIETPFQQSPEEEAPLTDEQQDFVNEVLPYLGQSSSYRPFLLHGITGSGKTRVYIELVRQVTAQGRQAIVLIPEIVLTPQTMARFQRHFGQRVAAVHSRLTPAERAEILHRAREGSLDVILGPRSAVFAPFPRLGLIVVDEEHEASYKQTDAVPRYNARDVALYRAYLNNIPIILGSATPSFESLYNARQQRYRYFHLGKRIQQRQLPRVFVVDLKEEWRRSGSLPLISENLMLKIEARLVSREQVMLLQNVRGYSPFIQCRDCGYIERCEQCDITLTYHARGKQLRCHYCGYQKPAPDCCPRCKGIDILYKGVGTQKIEEAVQEHFPHARILRMDQDTTGGKHGHARILEAFRQGKADILIGTKMIAKGLDFERVTLVGIISADQGLNFPDFRAAEKVFQLLAQAAGRAGRGASGGEVVVQTYQPDHFMFPLLLAHDYLAFYQKAIQGRESLLYPPFSRLALVRVVGHEEDMVVSFARKIAQFLRRYQKEQKFRLYGPAPAPLARVNNQYRYHILLKVPRQADPAMGFVRRLLKEGLYKNNDLKKWPVKVQIDVDPIEIL